MSRSVRPTRFLDVRTPRERIDAAIANAEHLHGDQPAEKRVVIVRAADILAVIEDCEPSEGDERALTEGSD